LFFPGRCIGAKLLTGRLDDPPGAGLLRHTLPQLTALPRQDEALRQEVKVAAAELELHRLVAPPEPVLPGDLCEAGERGQRHQAVLRQERLRVVVVLGEDTNQAGLILPFGHQLSVG
jgi:hypothetical protein